MIFLVVIAALYGVMAATHSWSPRLGLDLRGGTTITLTAGANDGKAPSKTSLEQARNIIQQRVNSLGVGESSVKTAGDRNIVVSAPNVDSEKLLNMVGQTAKLGFRFVYTEEQVDKSQAGPSASATASSGAAAPQGLPSAPSTEIPKASGLPSAPAGSGTGAQKYNDKSASSEAGRMKAAQSWQPSEEDQQKFQDYTCGDPSTQEENDPLVTCNREGTMKFLLSPVGIPGTLVTKSTAGIPDQGVSYVVNLQFNAIGTKSFSTATTALCSQQAPQNQFAIVLDGKVVSNPELNPQTSQGACPITSGEAQISGNFTQESADELSNILKYGALPLAFTASSVDNVSPTLGGEQLKAGLIAGLIGLILVAGYCILYYRGLGIVVISSLLIAGAGTYAAMVLLGESMGFTLSLAGVAGAIVAIGITADSFIVYFERIRDEIREGRTLRTALQTGWLKARGTIAMADGVSLLSAVILFILSVDQVKGFAFTLGLTTVIDLLICFFFTHPVVVLLGRTRFWGEGRRFSGLEARHMGVSELSLLGRRAARARARNSTAADTSVTDDGEEA
ncbi:protein translocase subunit SecD [Acidipropionibacterium virtanenii]|uniref:protein translocase subunit SecD n=1 Tax=Acidipropionibacterium virtanenii TaxID=2057246 RepID=UPI000DEC701B|nr:protein translocase subunit SecD [Acidipropionibacterium virtanenii]